MVSPPHPRRARALTLAAALLLATPAASAGPTPASAAPQTRVRPAKPGLLRRVISRVRPPRASFAARKLRRARKGPGKVVRSWRWRAGAKLSAVEGILRQLPKNWRVAVRGPSGGYFFQEVGWVLETLAGKPGMTLMDGRVYPPKAVLVAGARGQLEGRGEGKLLAAEEFFDGKQTVTRYYRAEDLNEIRKDNVVGLKVVKPADAAALKRAVKGLRGDEVVDAEFSRVKPGSGAERVRGLFTVNQLRGELKKGAALAPPKLRRLQGKGEPKASRWTAYRRNRRPLWGKGRAGPRPEAVQQGSTLGDCWLLATLASVTRANPKFVQDAIRPRGNGAFEVRLFVPTRGGKAVPTWIPVSDRLPKLAGLWTHYARSGGGTWVSLVEKAAAKVAGSYRGLDGGHMGERHLDAFELLTGARATTRRTAGMAGGEALTTLQRALARGHVVTASTAEGIGWKGLRRGLVPNHRYSVKSVDAAAGTVELQNPWGFAHPRRLPVEKFLQSFDQINVAASPGVAPPR